MHSGFPHGGPPSRAQPGRVRSPQAPAATDGTPTGDVAASFCATLVDEWVRSGVTDAVISPGSRSTPITVALDADERIRLNVVHDERSAAYMALGMALGSGRPCIVACTSGTAAVNFHPAVVEADLAAVPMLVVTADRPPELHGVFAPQTIDQRELYGSSTRWYCEPGPPAAGGAPWWRDLARDALARCSGGVPGPVHLDLAFREPLLGDPGELPPVIDDQDFTPPSVAGLPFGLLDEDAARLATTISGRRGLIVAGCRSACDASEAEQVWSFADALGWPVIADAASGLRCDRPGVVSTNDALLRHPAFADAHRPEVVFRFGGLLSSKVTAMWLAASGAPQFGFDRFGRSPDPDHSLSASFGVVPAVATTALLETGAAGAPPDWREGWMSAEGRARRALRDAADRGRGEASEPVVAMDVAAAVPGGGNLVVSSSMPVRDLEWFAAPRDDVMVHANRGANGIDGLTATATGVAVATSSPTVLLTGDIAFLHDVGSLTSLRGRGVDLTIVVIDNDGGGIFSFLPQADELTPAAFERLFGTPHGTDVAKVASAFGLPVEAVHSRAGLQAALAGAISRRGPRVVVVRTDRHTNVAEHRRFHTAVSRCLGSSPG